MRAKACPSCLIRPPFDCALRRTHGRAAGDVTNLHQDLRKYLKSQIFGLRSCAEGGRGDLLHLYSCQWGDLIDLDLSFSVLHVPLITCSRLQRPNQTAPTCLCKGIIFHFCVPRVIEGKTSPSPILSLKDGVLKRAVDLAHNRLKCPPALFSLFLLADVAHANVLRPERLYARRVPVASSFKLHRPAVTLMDKQIAA